MSGNKTSVITYNLSDRGRQYNGADRSDVDIKSWIDQINSPKVQELVNSGDLFGFNGHEIRARFGMHPPDKFVNDKTGTVIRIEPAIRTIKLSADNDGNVTSQHEFLDTDDGRYAQKLYSSKVGGFSNAVTRVPGQDGKYRITGFYGYDFVRTPNYNTCRGYSSGAFDSLVTGIFDDEMAFDSMTELTPERMMLKEVLEMVIANQYDSIQTALQAEGLVNHYQEQALAAQVALIASREREINRRRRARERQEEIYDSMILPAVPFADILNQWDSFNNSDISDNLLKVTGDKHSKADTQDRQDRLPRFFNR